VHGEWDEVQRLDDHLKNGLMILVAKQDLGRRKIEAD
jgi:hypothetical protein